MLREIALSAILSLSSVVYAISPSQITHNLEALLNQGNINEAVSIIEQESEPMLMSSSVFEKLKENYDPTSETSYLLFSHNGIIDTTRKPKQQYLEKNFGFGQAKILDTDEEDACRIILEEHKSGGRFVGDYHNHPDTEPPTPSDMFGMMGDVGVAFYDNLLRVGGPEFKKLQKPQTDIGFIGGGTEFTVKGFAYIGPKRTPELVRRLDLTEKGLRTLLEVNRKVVGPGFDMAPQLFMVKYVQVPVNVISLREEMANIDAIDPGFEQVLKSRAAYNLTGKLESFASINPAIANLNNEELALAEKQLYRLMNSFDFIGPEENSWKAYALSGPAILLRNRPDIVELFDKQPHTLSYKDKVISGGREVSGNYKTGQYAYEIRKKRMWLPEDFGEDVPTHEFFHAVDGLEKEMDHQLPLCEEQSSLNELYATLWNYRVTTEKNAGLPWYAFANSREFVAETAMLFHTERVALSNVRFSRNNGKLIVDLKGEPLLTQFYQKYLQIN